MSETTYGRRRAIAYMDELLAAKGKAAFDDVGSRSIARALLTAHPQTWPSLNSARQCVMSIRGIAKGCGKAKSIARFVRDKREPGECGMLKLPKEWDEWSDADRLIELEPGTWLCLSDIHWPFHDTKALRTALDWGRERQPDHIMLMGDAADFYSVSDHQKDPELWKLKREVDIGKRVLDVIGETFPDSQIVWKEGNHEERLTRYLNRTALKDMFDVPMAYDLDARGIRWIRGRCLCRVGKLYVIHGHEFGRFFGSPVNPARGLYNKGHTTAICGHLHRSSEHSERHLDESITACWSLGCLCQLYPQYLPINKWNHGFALVTADAGGAFHVENRKIIDGKVY